MAVGTPTLRQVTVSVTGATSRGSAVIPKGAANTKVVSAEVVSVPDEVKVHSFVLSNTADTDGSLVYSAQGPSTSVSFSVILTLGDVSTA